ncbi:MAG: ferritin-like domain-containing protein [Myxococcota bacterium]
MTTLDQHLTHLYLKRLLASAEGRAFILNQCAQAEASDEGQVFDSLARNVDDPELRKLVRIHQQDEQRHAELFNACLARHGGKPSTVPEELRLIERIAKKLNNLFARPIEGPQSVMEHYLLLQVIEERALTQFAVFEQAFRAIDPETAEVFAEVARDEERHLKYCHAIARRYAPSREVHEATLRRMRELELDAFTENSRAVMLHTLDLGLAKVGWLEKKMWRALASLNTARGKKQRTPFWDQGVDSRLTSLAVAA